MMFITLYIQIRIDQETRIRDEGELFTVENYADGIIEFKCATKEDKVMWLAHLYQVRKNAAILLSADSILNITIENQLILGKKIKLKLFQIQCNSKYIINLFF